MLDVKEEVLFFAKKKELITDTDKSHGAIASDSSKQF